MACRLRRAASAAVVAGMLLAAASNQADENANPAADATGQREVEQAPTADGAGTWYGWQILLVDAASVGVLYLSARGNSEAGWWLSMVPWTFGGSVVRTLHHDPGAFWSLGRRLLLPFGCALVGAGLSGGFDHNSSSSGEEIPKGVAGALLGYAVGASIAMVYDWATAWEPARLEQRGRSGAWTPVVVATGRMRGIGVALRF